MEENDAVFVLDNVRVLSSNERTTYYFRPVDLERQVFTGPPVKLEVWKNRIASLGPGYDRSVHPLPAGDYAKVGSKRVVPQITKKDCLQTNMPVYRLEAGQAYLDAGVPQDTGMRDRVRQTTLRTLSIHLSAAGLGSYDVNFAEPIARIEIEDEDRPGGRTCGRPKGFSLEMDQRAEES